MCDFLNIQYLVTNVMMMMGMVELCEGIIRFTYALHSTSFSNSNSEQARDYEYPIWNGPQRSIDIEIRTIFEILEYFEGIHHTFQIGNE